MLREQVGLDGGSDQREAEPVEAPSEGLDVTGVLPVDPRPDLGELPFEGVAGEGDGVDRGLVVVGVVLGRHHGLRHVAERPDDGSQKPTLRDVVGPLDLAVTRAEELQGVHADLTDALVDGHVRVEVRAPRLVAAGTEVELQLDTVTFGQLVKAVLDDGLHRRPAAVLPGGREVGREHQVFELGDLHFGLLSTQKTILSDARTY